MSETLRQMLDRREAELLAEARDLVARLTPVQREIEEVRAARAAIIRVQEIPAKGSEAGKAASFYWSNTEPNAAYRNMTMKQLVRTALTDHFKDGATASQMLDLFHKTFGRDDIVRSSLSPQLSRLKVEGEVTFNGAIWALVERETSREEQAAHDRPKRKFFLKPYGEQDVQTEAPEA